MQNRLATAPKRPYVDPSVIYGASTDLKLQSKRPIKTNQQNKRNPGAKIDSRQNTGVTEIGDGKSISF